MSDIPALVDALRSRVVGVVALPDDPDYARIAPWIVTVEVAPCVAVFATSAADVAAVVQVAAEFGRTVAVQGTGHGALPVDSGSILVHTAELDRCDVDPGLRTARVGAGVRWSRVLEAAAPHGLAPLCGSSPSVGVVGFLTGAGIGPLVRSVGLSSDYVRSFELVTGAGEVLRVTPERNADLFWGLRGGKATLGIVTEVEISLPEIAEFYGGALYFDGADAAAVLHEWRRWCVGLPESVTTSVALLQLPDAPGVPEPLAGRLTVAVRIVALGDLAFAASLVAPMRAAAAVIVDAVAVQPYSAIAAVHSDPPDPMPVYEDQALLRELPAEAVDAVLALAGPGSGSPQVIVELRQFGGAFARPGPYPSAFCHRDAAFALATIGGPGPDTAAAVAAHASSVMSAVAPWALGGQHPNFAPASGAERLARCYSPDVLARLVDLGERHDPAGVLRVGQVARD